MFDHDIKIPIGFDLPWGLALLFLIGFFTKTLSFEEKKDALSSPPKNIIQLEVNLSTKNAGKFMVFENGDLASQGTFKSAGDLRSQINQIDKGFIDTDNMNLSLGDLKVFKQNLNLPNVMIYHVR